MNDELFRIMNKIKRNDCLCIYITPTVIQNITHTAHNYWILEENFCTSSNTMNITMNIKHYGHKDSSNYTRCY